ncbi:sugar O-acetyltransferase [uncultured Shewanella sp.]|uniref:sugar O-acetyltransferase n=1 Tax=Shewanella atlantica TaxID=271099 RepID=UPI0026017067|nr:sugar O-acetyltransferase [uncultured Shewanella sp.]
MNQELSNYQKMISGLEYNYLDMEIMELRKQQQIRNRQANLMLDYQHDEKLLPHISSDAIIVPPFYISYGLHIHLGSRVYINSNVTLQDNAPIHIGEHTMVGPNVQFYTANHPLDAEKRCRGFEIAKAITVGKRVWIGGGAVILPGISIGDEAVVGAGSVVTKDVQAKTVVAGNPAKLIKVLSPDNQHRQAPEL